MDNLKKKLYISKNQKSPKIKKIKTNPCFNYPPKPRPKKIINYPEKYSFTPLINKKSKKAWEKRNTNLVKHITPEKSISKSSINNKKRTPIGFILYEDANNKKEKMKQIYLDDNENIKSNANIAKMNKNSFNMVIDRVNKKINNIVNKYSVNEKLSIVKIVRCFSDLKIINELIKSDQNTNELNIEKLRAIINNIDNKDHKKIEELIFIEQIWFKINPSMKEYINNKIFLELLKILFSSNDNDINNINQLTTLIENLLDNNIINSNSNDSNNIELYVSPLRDKNYEINELWDIPQLIKKFLKLKSDIICYKNNDYEYKKEKLYNNLMKEEEKELTFEPDISKSYYKFDKNSKYNLYNNNNKDILNKTYTNFSRGGKYDFNKIYERFMNQKKMQEKVLEKLRKIKDQKELKKCTHTPKISHYPQKKINRNNISIDNEDSKKPIYERLYDLRKNKNGIISSRNSRLENNNIGERQMTEDNINRNNNKNKNKKKVRPFNINDLGEEKYGKNISNTYKKDKNINDNIIDNIYITIDIKIPNGESKSLKIYQNKDNIEDSINEFCHLYNINEKDKKVILNKAYLYKNIFYGNYKNEEENNDFITNEDMDTNANTHVTASKNSTESKKINNKHDEKLNIIDKDNINYENNNNKQNNNLKSLDDYITYKNDYIN